MLREITEDKIIFRNVVSAKEGVMEYDDGKWYKPAEEIKKASLETDIVPLVTGTHQNYREIGVVTKPKYGKPYKRGKMIRDWIFDRKKMTPEEESLLLSGEKMEVSMGYSCKDIPTKGKYLDQRYDGLNTDIKIDHFLWTSFGRCSEKDGCGLRRNDSLENVRYDSLEMKVCEDCQDMDLFNEMVKTANIRGDEKETLKDCVGRKIGIIRKEHPEWENKQVVAVAYAYCREKQKKGRKRSDSMPEKTEEGEGTPPPEGEGEDKVTLEAIKKDLLSIQEFVKGLKPETQEGSGEKLEKEEQSEPEAVDFATKDDIQKVLETINILKEELGKINSTFEKVSAPPRSTTFNLKEK